MTDVFLALLRYTSQNEKSYPRSTLHQHEGPCASMSQEINIREQSSNEHHLPVLDRQTVSMLMCQTLDRQEVELLQWQLQAMSDWTGPATSGVYRLAGTGRDQDREGEGALIPKVLSLKVLSPTPEGRTPASCRPGPVPHWKAEPPFHQ